MNGDTRLSEALAVSPEILEYVISLNPHDFERLRNPLMYKVMPPRISLRRVAAIVGISEQELVDKINELAGLPKESAEQKPVPQRSSEKPDWLKNLDSDKIKWVDVTPLDAVLDDPMPPINVAVNTGKPGDVVGIMHKWEPQPLYDIWYPRGLKFWSQQINPDLWHIFVYRPK